MARTLNPGSQNKRSYWGIIPVFKQTCPREGNVFLGEESLDLTPRALHSCSTVFLQPVVVTSSMNGVTYVRGQLGADRQRVPSVRLGWSGGCKVRIVSLPTGGGLASLSHDPS